MNKANEPLDSKVLKWLQEQGFPLEMEVASVARKIGFDVIQSDYYIDQETGKSREIDLVLTKVAFNETCFNAYKLFVECKSSENGKPWLIFCTPKQTYTDEHGFDAFNDVVEGYAGCIFSPMGGKTVIAKDYQDRIEKLYPRLYTESLIGYGVTQAFAQASDVPYTAMMSATKAALASKEKNEDFDVSPHLLFASPVVVIDVPLFAVTHCSETNELKLVEISYGTILWKQHVGGRSKLGVYVVTKEGLPEFLGKCYSCSNWWVTLAPSPKE